MHCLKPNLANTQKSNFLIFNWKIWKILKQNRFIALKNKNIYVIISKAWNFPCSLLILRDRQFIMVLEHRIACSLFFLLFTNTIIYSYICSVNSILEHLFDFLFVFMFYLFYFWKCNIS